MGKLTQSDLLSRLEFARANPPEGYAKKYGCTIAAAKEWYNRHNVPFERKRKTPQISLKQWMEDAPRYSAKELAEKYGLKTTTIYWLGEEYGIKPRKGSRTNEITLIMAGKLKAVGFAPALIARELGVTVAEVEALTADEKKEVLKKIIEE